MAMRKGGDNFMKESMVKARHFSKKKQTDLFKIISSKSPKKHQKTTKT